MKIPLSWLREFVDVPGSAAEIGAAMSLRGFAVEGIETLADDSVIDFEVTANRPDCLSVIGLAREIATAYGLQVRRLLARVRSGPKDTSAPTDAIDQTPGLQLLSLKSVESGDIDISIENPDLCPRYAGAVADVEIRDSPPWLQKRLRAAGVRPISNIVDVTNYVLLELGHPMHAFDQAKLTGDRISVRTAHPGETIRTLDGQMRELAEDMLVIADARAVAVAGVMGGADSEVTRETKSIVLESAYFNPLSIRRTSKRLGLKTEASIRFERGADPRLPVTAMERACALIEHIGAGQARGTVVDRHPARIEPRQLRLRRARIAALVGARVEDAEIKRILEGLGFALRDASDGWDIIVPTRRIDVLREVDLIEEVARHHGFDRVPATFPAPASPAPSIDPRILQARALRAVMTGEGFSEAATFGFMAAPAASRFASGDEIVPIANPLSENYAVLRPSVVPGLVDAVAHNRRREQDDVRLFEIGARFSRTLGERRAIAFAWTGQAVDAHWSARPRAVDFFDVKGAVERLCEALGLGGQTAAVQEPWLVPGRSAALVVDGRRVATFGQLTGEIAEQHGLPAADAVYVGELDLDEAAAVRDGRALRVEPLPRFPSVTRDISVLVEAALTAEAVRQTIRSAAPDTLVSIREFDRYQGKGIPEGRVSLSVRLTFRAADRTLTDGEVQDAMDAVMSALRDRHGAVQR